MTSKAFNITRDVLYGLIAASSLCVMGFSAARVEHFRTRRARLNPYLVPLIAASFSMAFLLPRYLLCRFKKLPGVLTHLWVELTLLWCSSVIFLFGAGYETFHLNGIRVCKSEICQRARAMEAFCWVAWASMLILMGMLVVHAIRERRSGKSSVLTKPVVGKVVDEDDLHEGDFGIPMANKGAQFAGREV